MSWLDGERTDPALLARLGDWTDAGAWREFLRHYDALIRQECRAYHFDPETTEELCQRIWIELARQLRGYRYDPGRRFRGWLRRLCRSRAIDLWRQRRAEAQRRGLAPPVEELADPRPEPGFPEGPAAGDSTLLRRARRVQEAVRRRVDDRTWQVFWSIAVDGRSVRETAETHALSYAAAFACQRRVGRMLRAEGDRLAATPRTTSLALGAGDAP